MIEATIPLHETVGYVAAAYAVVFVLLLVYLAIMARRVRGMERDLQRLQEMDAGGREQAEDDLAGVERTLDGDRASSAKGGARESSLA